MSVGVILEARKIKIEKFLVNVQLPILVVNPCIRTGSHLHFQFVSRLPSNAVLIFVFNRYLYNTYIKH